MVEHIEHFTAELKLQLLSNRGDLEDREVDVHDAWPAHIRQRPRYIAKRVVGRVDKGRSVEPFRDGWIVKLCTYTWHEIRARCEFVVCSSNRQRGSSLELRHGIDLESTY